MQFSSLARDMRAVEEGVWVQPNPAEKAEFRVRAITAKYKMRRDAMVARLTRQHRLWDAVPEELKAAEQARILFEELVMEVRGIVHEDGRPVTLDEYRALASTFRGGPALDLAFAAVDMATARRESDARDAVGNSLPSSPPPMAATGSLPCSPETTPTP